MTAITKLVKTGRRHIEMSKVIFDGDMFIYKSAFSSEVETRWDDNIWTMHSDINKAKVDIEISMGEIMAKLDRTDMVVALSDGENFRNEIFPQYKLNRKDTRKPLGIKELRGWVLKNYKCVMRSRLEADDICGILCTRNKDYIAVSGDKDFGTLPITWYNHLSGDLKTTTKQEADQFHLIQTLTGDTTDGYQGLPGVGPKTAEKIFQKSGYLWSTVVAAYQKKGFDEEDALVTARLSHILRDEDVDWDTGKTKIKLWEPKPTK